MTAEPRAVRGPRARAGGRVPEEWVPPVPAHYPDATGEAAPELRV
ncbi:hypothetical protein [Longimicrobium sp.]|nr:hypothetical protein [Longimicrobium sp.]